MILMFRTNCKTQNIRDVFLPVSLNPESTNIKTTTTTTTTMMKIKIKIVRDMKMMKKVISIM